MAGIAQFRNFFRWMEEVEHAFFRSMGFSIEEERDGRKIGWPRLSATCSYSRPVRFEEEMDILLEVARVGTKALTCSYLFQLDGEEVAQGEMVTVCCQCDPAGNLEAIPIPAEIRDAISHSE